jgi:alpha-galactosidase
LLASCPNRLSPLSAKRRGAGSTEAQRAEAAQWIARYKDIRHIVQLGDLYRLHSPRDHALSALQYVSKDRAEGVLFAFRTFIPDPAQLPIIYLDGLDPDALYEVEGFPGRRSGQAWVKAGVQLELELSNFQSTIRHIRRT